VYTELTDLTFQRSSFFRLVSNPHLLPLETKFLFRSLEMPLHGFQAFWNQKEYTHNQRLNMWSILIFNLEYKAVSKGWQSLWYILARKLLQWQEDIQIYRCQRTEWLLEWAVLNNWLHSKLKDNTEQTRIQEQLGSDLSRNTSYPGLKFLAALVNSLQAHPR
jgi:hypothetical protein